ncbi:acyl-homoserine-lactone synthase [Sphingomonas sp. AR_OL41]|uniref:acyl-homoserine-lactone synthase n=1 Tax=Sphingomonas sp. AR_OL41 TaxID=3042729 RepID=UPI002480A10B|nr:acyl-homoserine-lactone synthase [Sphingomonas sp. AR_OL41]MDH7974494.1 acyl-homoserine-lactone synthase [Sphingomonas sp. AR_OL41]
MAQLLSTTLQTSNDDALRAMFAARKRVFIDLLKWDLPALDGKFEIDEFDNEHAHYLILLDRDGGHLGSTRLLPTTRRHILGGLFASLCDGPVPTGPVTYEITRFCLDRSLRAPERRSVRDQLITAIVQHAMHEGIERYTGVAEMAWLRQILGFGWDCRPLGTPQSGPCGTIGAIEIRIADDTSTLLDATGIWRPVTTLICNERRAAGARN